jgi:hypothetical protein
VAQHGNSAYPRQPAPPLSRHYVPGRFGRLFDLPPFASNTQRVRRALRALGKRGGPMDGGLAPKELLNHSLPAGFTYLGQFIAHDMSYDPTSSLEQQRDPEALRNFRTPALDLDSLYGGGPFGSPHLYQKRNWSKFLIGKLGSGVEDDLPRNTEGIALLADPRNDDNLIVSQLTLAFLKFHNRIIDNHDIVPKWVTNRWERFLLAQRAVRWHYQWMVLHQYLPRVVGYPIWADVLGKNIQTTRRLFFTRRRVPYIPAEFSVAAFRFGHSQVVEAYQINEWPYRIEDWPYPGPVECGPPHNKLKPFIDVPIFSRVAGFQDICGLDLRGGLSITGRFVEWDRFFDLGRNSGPGHPQLSRRIDTQLATGLLRVPRQALDEEATPTSVAQRDLLRHLTFCLPSGQDVAKAMKHAFPPGQRFLDDSDFEEDLGGWEFLQHSTPLWYYILKEADLLGDHQGVDENSLDMEAAGGPSVLPEYSSQIDKRQNQALGPIGGRLVAEVIIGLLEDDPESCLRQDPDWRPRLMANRRFGIEDLLRYADMPLSEPGMVVFVE